MHRLFSSLGTRLALAFALLLLVLGIAFFSLIHWSNNRYYQEITQRLNQSLAMYIAQREPLIQQGVVNHSAMKTLGDLVMIVNPIVEVYLLDTQGNILAHSVPPETLVRPRVTTAPIHAWLGKNAQLPIQGDDPRSPAGQRVFSAFPVQDGENTAGFLYVILGGQTFQTLSESLRGSYILQQSLGGLLVLTLFALVSAIVISLVLTRPLRRLSQAMNNFHQHELPSHPPAPSSSDEITHLAHTFFAMRQRINEQLQHLQDTDRLRRELISNVSHDLRTPLSAMQGYLEMLLRPGNTQEQARSYLNIAFKHCHRLSQLVKELFELSKLDAGRIQPQWEQFSMAELLQDVVQKFSLMAQNKGIQFIFPPPQQAYSVCADIALIERVLENLIDNALRYTPAGGRIELHLEQQPEQIQVAVKDSGTGLKPQDIPHIFERYYRGQDSDDQHPPGTGLGLAIVKRILALHHSEIRVKTHTQGTCFYFPLPRHPNTQTPAAA
jgi:signal transduction histidine kinase